MIDQTLLDLLASPDDGSSLVPAIGSDQLVSQKEKVTYPIVGNVPVLLPVGALDKQKASEFHDKLNSDFHYVDHYKKDAELFDYFEEYPDQATIHENRRLHEAILREIPVDSRVILDVGSGNAWMARAHAKKLDTKVISFDIALENTKKAMERFPSPNHFAVTGDVYALPFQPEQMDCIVSAEVIEHVPEPRQFVHALYAALKPGGKLIITTPYDEKIPHYLCVHCNRPTPQHAHIHSFDERKILSYVPKGAKSARAYAFSNHYLAKARTHVLLQYFPHSAWRVIDNLTNKFIKKQGRLVLTVVKG